jgi:hypothetical protein
MRWTDYVNIRDEDRSLDMYFSYKPTWPREEEKRGSGLPGL